MVRASRADSEPVSKLCWADEFVGQEQKLKRIAAGMGLAPADAEDVLQEVYLQALRNPGSNRETEKAGRWLMRVTINRCLLEHRRRKRFQRAAAEIIERRAKRPKAPDTPIDQAIRTEELEEVRKGLGQLDESLLGPMVLRYFMDFNSQEIGEILRLNPATVRSRLRQGRFKLAELLKKW
ncbi:MAG: hypothetical protein AMJ79_07095 [Phycisphaerae bacterium SM23_30]|nr:MAG: hypothetical protein AMJ79_07095 [Phycisphaerae bacterium SM23_30]